MTIIPFPNEKRPSKADLTFDPIESQESINARIDAKKRVRAATFLARVAKWCLLGFAFLVLLIFLSIL